MLQNFRKVIVYFLFLLTQFVVVSHLEAAPAQSINADKVHSNGLFIGNHHLDIKGALKKLDSLIIKNFGT